MSTTFVTQYRSFRAAMQYAAAQHSSICVATSPEAVAWRITTRTRLDPDTIYETPMAESASAMTDQQLVDLVAYLRNPRAGR